MQYFVIMWRGTLHTTADPLYLTAQTKRKVSFDRSFAVCCGNLLHTMIIRRLNMRARRPRFHIPSPVILRRLCSLTNSTWSLPNSLWTVPFLLQTSKVNFLMLPMRTIMWSSSGNRFASRCLSPSLAYIISSTRFTTILSTIAPRYSYHHAQTYAPISWTSSPQTMDAFGWNPILAPLHLSPLWLLQRHAKNEIAG